MSLKSGLIPEGSNGDGRESNPSSGSHRSSKLARQPGGKPMIRTTHLSGHRRASIQQLLDGPLGPALPGDTTIPGASVLAVEEGGDELRFFDPQTIRLTPEHQTAHVKIIGPTGAGKSQNLIIPMMISDLRAGKTVILVSSKPEEIAMAQAECETLGRKFLYLELADPEHSAGFNRLSTSDEGRAMAEIQRVAELYTNPASRDSWHWGQSFATLAFGLWQGGYQSWGAILEIIELGIPKLIKVLDGIDHPAARSAQDYLKDSNVNAGTMLASSSGYLHAFRSAVVRAVTDNHELGDRELFEQPVVILFRIQEPLLSTLRAEYAACTLWLIDRLIEAADEVQHTKRIPARMYIEDGASLGSFGLAFAQRALTLRARNVGLTMSYQSLAAIRSVYGPDANMLIQAMASTIILPGIDVSDAIDLAPNTGSRKVLEQVVGADGENLLTQVVTAPTIPPEEIMRPSHEHPELKRPVTFVLNDGVVFQAALTPAYARPDLKANAARCRDHPPSLPRRAQPLKPAKVMIPCDKEKSKAPPTAAAKIGKNIKTSKVESLRRKAGFDKLPKSAKEWWLRHEEANRHNARVVETLLQALVDRGHTIEDLWVAAGITGSGDAQKLLDWLAWFTIPKGSSTSRFMSYDLVTEENAGRYVFDGYVDDYGDDTPPEGYEMEIEVAPGEHFPIIDSTFRSAYWRRIK